MGVLLPTIFAATSCDRFDQQRLPTEGRAQLEPAHEVSSASQSYTYTTDADFDKGTLVNVNHDAPNNNQLQLNTGSGTFPFIWVALSQRCTIAKVNTATGAILGEYRTVADGVTCRESSRTTVGIDGSVWVGHRGRGGVAHIGLVELNQCVDRNGNGVIDTSTGYGDVKAWPGSSPSIVANAADECILHHVNTDALGFGDSRHMSIDANNKLWIGSYGGTRGFVRVNGATGTLETPVKTTSCGGYGGLIDKNGVIWSANGGTKGLLRWDPNAPDAAGINPRCIPIDNYGLAVDQNGWIWATTFFGHIYKVSANGGTVLGPFTHGSENGQGLAVDKDGDVWVSSGLFCNSNCTIGRLKNDGTFVGNIPITGTGPTGISIDADGKIWSANLSSHTATRIDPTVGIGSQDLSVSFPIGPGGRPLPSPYNYSDMTGAQLFGSTSPQGSWIVVRDGGAEGQEWGTITWNTEAQGSTPAGTSISVEARVADTQAGLGSQTYAAMSNGAEFNLAGRYIQVRVTLVAAADGTSPVLSDLIIRTTGTDEPPPPVGGGDGVQRPSIDIRDVTITGATKGTGSTATGHFTILNASGGDQTFVTLHNVELTFFSVARRGVRNTYTASCTITPVPPQGDTLDPNQAKRYDYEGCTFSPDIVTGANELTATVRVGSMTNQLGESRAGPPPTNSMPWRF